MCAPVMCDGRHVIARARQQRCIARPGDADTLGMTPLIPVERFGREIGVRRLDQSSRDALRAAVAQENIAAATIEAIVRTAMQRTPTPLVERARILLRRYFSFGPWRIEDDSALASIVGRGTGWHSIDIGADRVVEFGWRGAGFRISVVARGPITAASGVSQVGASSATGTTGAVSRLVSSEIIGVAPRVGASGATVNDAIFGPGAPPSSSRDGLRATQRAVAELVRATNLSPPTVESIPLVDTFDGPVATEAKHQPRIVGFLIGPSATATSDRWMRRTDRGLAPRMQRLFAAHTLIDGVWFAAGCYDIELRDAQGWFDALAPILTVMTIGFATPRRAPAPNSDETRARREFALVELRSPRGRVVVRDAIAARNPILRELGVAHIATTDPFQALNVYRRAIDDPARSVRRATIRAVHADARSEYRAIMERGLRDVDGYTRFLSVHAINAIGASTSRAAVEKIAADPDARVRLAALAVLQGIPPPL